MVTNKQTEEGIYAAVKSIAAHRTQYCVSVRVRTTGKVVERSFDSMMARTIFIITFEGNGFGTVLREWIA